MRRCEMRRSRENIPANSSKPRHTLLLFFQSGWVVYVFFVCAPTRVIYYMCKEEMPRTPMPRVVSTDLILTATMQMCRCPFLFLCMCFFWGWDAWHSSGEEWQRIPSFFSWFGPQHQWGTDMFLEYSVDLPVLLVEPVGFALTVGHPRSAHIESYWHTSCQF